jgi:hypothetical protein
MNAQENSPLSQRRMDSAWMFGSVLSAINEQGFCDSSWILTPLL